MYAAHVHYATREHKGFHLAADSAAELGPESSRPSNIVEPLPMSRPLIAALALAAVSALSVTSALAATKTVKSAQKPAAAAPAKPAEAEPVSEPVDNLTAG